MPVARFPPRHAARDFAADGADFALQIAHAGFARVIADELRHALVAKGDVARR